MTSSGNTVNYYFHLRKKVYKIIGQDISKLPGRSAPASHQFNNPLDSFQDQGTSVCLGFLFLNRHFQYCFSFSFFCFRTFLVCLLNLTFQTYTGCHPVSPSVSTVKSWRYLGQFPTGTLSVLMSDVLPQVFSHRQDEMCTLSLNSPLLIKPLQGKMMICTLSLFIIKSVLH